MTDEQALYKIMELLDIDEFELANVPDEALRPIMASLKETFITIVSDL
jgi:hypothetical protein